MEIRASHMDSKGTLVSHMDSKGTLVGPTLTNQKPNVVLQSPAASEHQEKSQTFHKKIKVKEGRFSFSH